MGSSDQPPTHLGTGWSYKSPLASALHNQKHNGEAIQPILTSEPPALAKTNTQNWKQKKTSSVFVGSHHFLPVQKRIQRNLAPRVTHKAPVLGNAPTAQSLASPRWHWFPHQQRCLSVHCRSVDHRGNQIRGGSRDRKQTHLVRQDTHWWNHSYSFFPGGLWYPTFPREDGHEQSKEEAEPGVFSRAPSEVKTRGTRTVGRPDLFAFTVRNIHLSPHPFPLMPLKALLKNV